MPAEETFNAVTWHRIDDGVNTSELAVRRQVSIALTDMATTGPLKRLVWVSALQRTDPNGRSNMRRTRTGSAPMWKFMACRSSARSDWVERLR